MHADFGFEAAVFGDCYQKYNPHDTLQIKLRETHLDAR